MMRAIEPHTAGFAVNPDDSVRIAYEVFGPEDAQRTVIFLPTWVLLHSRNWKMQVPYFAGEGFRVITFDGRGCGASDRPANGYSPNHYVGDTLAVLDALNVERAAVVCISMGAYWGVQLAAEYPERVSHLAVVASSAMVAPREKPDLSTFFEEPSEREGLNRFNAVYWRENYREFVTWFMNEVFSPPHSSKLIEDFISWGLETAPETLIASIVGVHDASLHEYVRLVRCPTLILEATDDRVTPPKLSRDLHTAIAHSKLVRITGSGHALGARDPVRVNLLIHEFAGRDEPRERHWERALTRPRRILFVSSSIGLGHVRRDIAIANELRAIVPGLQIDWLAQHPATAILDAHGERTHPRSSALASETRHIESRMSGPHELNIFHAFREMDEILLANFMVFLDTVRETPYDLWIGDEAWEVDHFLHENPELKTAPYVFMTDFLGWLPIDASPGSREAFLTADYNAEMLEHIDRFPALRDASIFIGNPNDIVPDAFGNELPSIRDWAEAHFDCTGFIRSFDPASLGERQALREQFGFAADEHVAVATAGGTMVGVGLLQRIINSFPLAPESAPNVRLIVVGGPRIDPSSLTSRPGIEVHGHLSNLPQLLAACDVAIVQGGLSTTMELVTLGRPFLSIPLTGHCEQQRHVAHRLAQYGVPACRGTSFANASPEWIAENVMLAVTGPVGYRAVEADGARRAAERIAQLL